MPSTPDPDASIVDRWLGYGADLAGALAGAGVGSAVAGPPGAVFGAVLGTGITTALSEASSRLLSAREKSRIGAVVVLARDRLIKHLEEGATLRGDEIIRARLDGRSPADEVIEHVLQVARGSFEERKLPHIAATLANVAVSDWLDERTAHWLITTVEGLSWPKLVALALIADKDNPLPDVELESVTEWSPWSLDRVFYELQYADSLVGRERRKSENGIPIFSSSLLSDMRLTAGGHLITSAADLASISPADRDEMHEALLAESKPLSN
ncbi:hypothetical protein ELQ92_02195 [Labedella populi]|uniref:DUF4393 domain-containing protein n=1 Tax=Labedella populi TaxID=2498850 RepID=A0A444QES6_9MICO|nr:hypothetical protein [Labedella populi]RWZ68083.1 hypothetical protein ELQ92_02195 [Labedella populi]